MNRCRSLTAEEVLRICTAGCQGRTGRRDRAFIALGAATGFRCSELLQMRRRDVLDSDGTIRDFLTVRKGHMKRKQKNRTVPLLPKVQAVLEDWLVAEEQLGLARAADAVFPSMRKGFESRMMTRNAAWKMLRRAAKRAGVKTHLVGIHSLRKTFCRNIDRRLLSMLAGGQPVAVDMRLQAAMGHEDIRSTQAYRQDVSGEDIQESFQAAAAALDFG